MKKLKTVQLNLIKKSKMIISKIQSRLRELLDLYGHVSFDKRLNRHVRRLPGTFVVFHEKDVNEIKKLKFPEECVNDWKRMGKYLDEIVEKNNEDPGSRQLVVSNMDDYMNVQPCFNLIQFIETNRGDSSTGMFEFDMYVYQRSHDIAKAHKDFAFFGYIASVFEQKTLDLVTKIVVIYGDLHEEQSN